MLLVLLFTQISSRSNAQGTIPSIGVDFWYGYMHNSATSNQELRLFVTSQVATTGTVDIPLQGWNTTFSVAPNITTTIIIPNLVGETTGSDIIETKGIHVTPFVISTQIVDSLGTNCSHKHRSPCSIHFVTLLRDCSTRGNPPGITWGSPKGPPGGSPTGWGSTCRAQ